MHIRSALISALSLSGFTLTTTARSHENQQQTLLGPPPDNFTLDPIRDALISNKVIGDVLNDFEPMYYLDIVYPSNDVRIQLGNEVNVSDLQTRPGLGIYLVPNRGGSPPVTQVPATFTIVLTDPDAKSRYNPKKSEMCHWIVTNITSSTTGELDFSGSIQVNPQDFEDDEAEDDDDMDELINTDIDYNDDDDDEDTTSGHKKKKHHDDKKKKKKHHDKHPRHHHKRCHKDKKGGKCLPGELRSYYPPSPPKKTGFHRYVFVLLQGDATEVYGPRKRKHWGFGMARHGVRDWALQYGLEVVGANFMFAENEKQ